MKTSRHTRRAFSLIILVLSLGLSTSARGQSSPTSATGFLVTPMTWRSASSFQAMPSSLANAPTLNRYLSYGSVIGIAGGLAWGALSEHRQTRALDIAGDAAIGWVAGMAGGVVAYIIQEASNRR